MADNDDRRIPLVVADPSGAPNLQSLNEIIRQLFMNVYKLEGRLGESVVRDDLKVMGKQTWEGQDTQSGTNSAGMIYFDTTSQKFKASENAGSLQTLIPNPKGIVATIGDVTGSAISTGVKGYLPIPVSGTITGWTLVADAVGSIVIDIWRDTYTAFPPTVTDTITGSEKPTLTAQQSNRDQSLSTWTTTVNAGDVLAFNVDSASTVKAVTLVLEFRT